MDKERLRCVNLKTYGVSLIVLLACTLAATATEPSRNTSRSRAPNKQEATTAMADLFWNSTTGTWNAASFGGTLPAATNRLYFDGRSAQDLTTSLDRTGDTAGAGLALETIEFKKSFRGDVGALASPLILQANNVIWRGTGEFYFKPGTGTSGIATVRLVIDTPNRSQEILIGPTFTNSNINQYDIHQGRVKLSSLLQANRLYIGFRNNPQLDSYVTVAGTPILLIKQIGGTFVYYGVQTNATDTFDVAGGECLFDGVAGVFTQTGGHVGFDEHPENNPSLNTAIATAWLLRGSMSAEGSVTGVITTAYIGPHYEITDEALSRITTPIYLDKEN